MDEERLEQSDSIASVVSWVERVTRRSLGDVRIHDSEQAGRLARRLGARAFTAGRDVYVRPELVAPLTPEGAALLAHELYHVAEQSGEGLTEEMVMPLLRPASPPQARGYAPDASGWGTREPAIRAASPAVGATEPHSTSLPVQRAAAGGQSGSESVAETVAGVAVQRVVTTWLTGPVDDNEAPAAKKGQPPPEPEIVADIVYSRMLKEVLLERERGAY